MLKKLADKTYFTKQIFDLLDKIYGVSRLKDSVLERAMHYFEQEQFLPSQESTDPAEHEKNRLDCQKRHSHLLSICHDIIVLCEGKDFEETNRKSAQFLGTIQLLSPTEGNKVTSNNEQCKALYKAILSLRLIDRLILDEKISDPYVLSFLINISPTQFANLATTQPTINARFIEQIKVPLLMAALLQDIGYYHPDALAIIKTDDIAKGVQEQENKPLAIEDKKQLLKISHQQAMKYLVKGLGQMNYVGNSREEREQFVLDEQNKQQFIGNLLKKSINPKNSIGNLLKVPQLYTAIILSTKTSYNYQVLPKVFQVLNKNAERGGCSQQVVDALYTITGIFPQGFGIVCFPIDEFGVHSDSYEYAIVCQLYPKNPQEPLCRMATRQLTFIGYGQDVAVKRESNLYFAETAKKLSALSKDRLDEILALMASNFKERKELDLLPRCWHAGEYFSVKDYQNLWNKA